MPRTLASRSLAASSTFAATPASNGASVNLSGTTATIGSNGVAQVTGTANSTTGSYSVAASSAGVATPFEFSLSNVLGSSSPTATIALATSGSSAVYGQSVTFVATVSASSTTPTGTVTFFDGATSLGTVSLNTAGQASLTTTSLPVGTQSITATYNGNALLPAVQSSATSESVSQASTEIVLAPQPVLNKKKKVVSVGLKAEIEPVSPGGGVPTGTVTFEILKKVKKKVKTTTLGKLPVNGGQATLTLKLNKVLKKAITIVYSGDGNFDSSTATPSPLTQQSLKSLARPMLALVNRGHKRSDAATAVHRG